MAMAAVQPTCDPFDFDQVQPPTAARPRVDGRGPRAFAMLHEEDAGVATPSSAARAHTPSLGSASSSRGVIVRLRPRSRTAAHTCCRRWAAAGLAAVAGIGAFAVVLRLMLPAPAPLPAQRTSPPQQPSSPLSPPPKPFAPPPTPLAPPNVPPPLPSTPAPLPEGIRKLVRRFHVPPWNVSWPTDGALAEAGLLIHVFDGWEDNAAPWAPATTGPGATEQGASLVFAAQRMSGESLPLIGGGTGGGIIFRPGIAKLNCGKAKDSAGTCAVWHPSTMRDSWCPSVSGVPATRGWGEPGDTCGYAWRPEDFGAYLHRLTAWQQHWQRLFYNEIIIDAPHWRDHLPGIVEAIYGRRDIYRRFLDRYGLDESQVPFVDVAFDDWEMPIRPG